LRDTGWLAHNPEAMSRATILHERVAQAVDDGADLEEVETQVIAPARVSGELRDALWLHAWGLLDDDDGFASRRDGQRFSR
jgi:hypothetical protein